MAILLVLPLPAAASQVAVAWGSYFQFQGDFWVEIDTGGRRVLEDIHRVIPSGERILGLREDGQILQGDFPLIPAPSGPPILDVAAGRNHILRLFVDGTVAQWNGGWPGIPSPPNGLSGIIAIAAGDNHSVLLRGDGTVLGLGNGATPPSGLRRVTRIVARGALSAAIQEDGTAAIWGLFSDGQSNMPAGLRGVTDVALGSEVVGVRRNDGSVVTWGHPVSVVPPGLAEVVSLVAGSRHFLALTSAGSVVAWGDNTMGQTRVPPGLSNVIAIAAGSWHSVALCRDGTMMAWGGPMNSRDGVPRGVRPVSAIAAWDNMTVAIGTPTEPVIVTQPTELVVSRYQNATLAVETEGFGLHYQWFHNRVALDNQPPSQTHRILGTPPFSISGSYHVVVSSPLGSATSLPIRVTVAPPAPGTVVGWTSPDPANTYAQERIPDHLTNVVAVAGTSGTTLALKQDGSVAAWTLYGWEPANVVEGLTNIVAVAAADQHWIALTERGEVIEWGRVFPESRPASLTNVVAVAAGPDHTLALQRDGTLVGWGAPDSPAAHIPSDLTRVVSISASWNHSVALTEEGEVVEWGADHSSGCHSVRPNDLGTVRSVISASRATMAIRTDGSLVGWGDLDCWSYLPPSTNVTEIFTVVGWHKRWIALLKDSVPISWGTSNLRGRPTGVGPSRGLTITDGWVFEIIGPEVPPRLGGRPDSGGLELSWNSWTDRYRLQRSETPDFQEPQTPLELPEHFDTARRFRVPHDTTEAYFRLMAP